MAGVHQNLNGSRDPIMPLSEVFIFRALALDTINLSTKFKYVSLPPTTRIWKTMQNDANGVVLG